MSGHVELWAWTGDEWEKVLIDAAGNLQVDVLTSALPAGGATAANQLLIIADTGTLVTEQGRCYGYDGANWQELLVESAASANLRTRLYDGVNPIISVGTGADIADTNRGLFTQAGVRGWDGTFWKSVNVEDGAGDALANARASLATVSKLYGYNGTTWDRLRVESDAAFNLRVKLYDGANGIDSKLLSANPLLTDRGLVTSARINAYDTVTGNFGVLYRIIEQDNIVGLKGLIVESFLYGWDGSAWDRLRVDAAFRLLTNSMLYDGANAIDSDQLDSNAFVSGDRGLLVRAQVCGYNLEPFHQRRTDSDALAAVSRELCQMTIAALYGYNGATFDRLRSYGTGILKVGRAEVGLLTVRRPAVGQVGAVGARKLYWMVLNPSVANSLFELSDDTDGLSAVVLDHFDSTRDGHMMTFDPPMEFTNGIYVKTFTNMTSIIFGYL